MSVLAKFMCSALIPTSAHNKNVTVHMHPVYSTEAENATFSKATPYGNLSMGIDEGTFASTYFKQGKCYKVTFEEVEK